MTTTHAGAVMLGTIVPKGLAWVQGTTAGSGGEQQQQVIATSREGGGSVGHDCA